MVAFFINGFIALLITLTLIVEILFSIFRYRLYDVDVFVSRALVYSSLTGILGFVGTATATRRRSPVEPLDQASTDRSTAFGGEGGI